MKHSLRLLWLVFALAALGTFGTLTTAPAGLAATPARVTVHPTVSTPVGDGISLRVPGQFGNRELARDGFVDVTAAPFNADPTGQKDSTAAIQKAVDAAKNAQMACWFPSGTYLVSDTIHCIQEHYRRTNGKVLGARLFPVVMVGEQAEGKPRPVIRLQDGAQGFGFPDEGKYLIHYWTRSEPYTNQKPNVPQPNVSMNMIFAGIDLDLGNNPGAIGIRMRAAQGSSIQDTRIDARQALKGVEGGAGSGGSHHHITVLGGRIGMDLSETQPTPTISGITLVDQTETAIVYTGRQALSAVGVRIQMRTGKTAITGPEKPLRAHNGQISLADSEIVFLGEPGTVVDSAQSLYMNNVYALNAKDLVATKGKPILQGTPDTWVHVPEYARSLPPPTLKKGNDFYNYSATSYIDGRAIGMFRPELEEGVMPPKGLFRQHLWTGLVPAWNDPRAVNVKTKYGARGDGRTDDTKALQKAIDENEILFLPKGYYAISAPLVLKPETKIVGVARHLSVIMAAERGDFAGDEPKPIIRTADTADASTVLANIELYAPRHLRAPYPLLWQCGGRSVIRDINCSTAPIKGYANAGKHAPKSEPEVLMSGHAGGRCYNLFFESALKHRRGYRHIAVTGTKGPLAFYQLNAEHARSGGNVEIKGAENVDIFGLKSEGNEPVLLLEKSRNVRVFGYGGNAAALPGRSLFVLRGSSDILLALLVDSPRVAGGSLDHFAGMGVPPTKWYMIRDYPSRADASATPPADRPTLYKRGNPEARKPEYTPETTARAVQQ